MIGGVVLAQLDNKMARIFQNQKPALNMSLLRSWVGNTLVGDASFYRVC